MASENKYGHITTERGHIPDDEPVFLLRAKDMAADAALRAYMDECVALSCSPQHIEGIIAAIERFEKFRAEHGQRKPGESER